MTSTEGLYSKRRTDKELPDWFRKALGGVEELFGLGEGHSSNGKEPRRRYTRREVLGRTIGAIVVTGGIGFLLKSRGKEEREEEIVEIEKVVMTERGADIFKSFNYIFGENTMERHGNPPDIKIRINARKRTEDEIIEIASQKKAQFDSEIFKEVCKRYNISPLSALALMFWESRLNPTAIGPTDDRGLYQIIDETGIPALVGVVKDLTNGMESRDTNERDFCTRIWKTAITDNPKDRGQIAEKVERIRELDKRARHLNIQDGNKLDAVRKSIQDDMNRLDDEIRDIVAKWYRPFDPNQNSVIGTWLQRDNLDRLTKRLDRNLSPGEQTNFMFALHYTGLSNAEFVLRHGMTYEEFVNVYNDRALRIHDDSCRKFLGALIAIRKD